MLIQDYEKYLRTARETEEKRMGYPLTGSSLGFFRNGQWSKSSEGRRIVDSSALGITPNSIASTLLINIGDPSENKASRSSREAKGQFYPEDIENDAVAILAKYFGTTAENVNGYVTSGGTEANLACAWWLRESLQTKMSKQKTLDKDIRCNPILFASQSAHYSCFKIANILQIPINFIQTQPDGQMDLMDLEQQIITHVQTKPHQAILMWTTFGTTIYGAVDNIVEIKRILAKHVDDEQYAIHTDGAILAMAAPVLYPQYRMMFDYTDTLTISGHKLLATNATCGIALAKTKIVEYAFANKSIRPEYLHQIKDTTISGGRWCVPIFELHLALKRFEIDQDATPFRQLLFHYLENAMYLTAELRKILGYHHVHYNPKQFNVVFPLKMHPNDAEKLSEKYTLMSLKDQRACITVFANVDRGLIDSFIRDYREKYQRQQLQGGEEIISLRPRL